MLKTIIEKKERKNPESLKGFNVLVVVVVVVVVVCLFVCFFFLFFFFSFSFKLKRLTQNPKTELKMLWVGLDSGIK